MKKIMQQKLVKVIYLFPLILMSLSELVAEPVQARQDNNPQPRAVIEQLYEYFEIGDMEGILSLLDPEVVFTLYGPEHLIPWAGTYKGHAGVGQFFSDIMQTIELSEVTHDQFVVDGEYVNVIGRDIGIAKSTGGEFNSIHLHSWHVKNGKIVSLNEIVDSAELISALAPADPIRGQAYFTTCAGCHGLKAEGNPAMRAPRLTLQDTGYLLRQLRHFRTQVRGGVTDFYGWQMNGRAKALPDDRALRDVLAYIDMLPDTHADDSVEGNKRKGKRLYKNNCSICHGDKAEGIEELNAPVLAGLESWYQLEQMRKYKNGLRGNDESDITGQQMRAAMTLVKDEAAMKDIIEYIGSIK